MSCFDNFIGLRLTCEAPVAPESGLYINDMPMGGLDRLESLSDQESSDFSLLWEKVYNRSVSFFKSDVRKLLPIRIRSNDILDNTITGDLLDPKSEVGNNARRTGVFLKVYGSPNLSINVPFVRFWLKVSASIDVMIFDCVTGDELYNESHACVAGMNTIFTKLDYATFAGVKKIFVCIDTDTHLFADANSQGVNPATDLMSWQGAYMTNQLNTPAIESNLTKTSNTGGVVAGIALRCDLDRWICTNRMALANALIFKCMIELYRQALEGDQIINRYTLIDPDEIRKRITSYQEQYVNELTTVLQTIPITDAVCFECSQPVQPKYQTG